QYILVPPQVSNTSNLRQLLVPYTTLILENLRMCEACVATKLNHTSSFATAPAPQLTKLSVAPAVVPAVTVLQTKFGFTVRLIALAHSSFTGGVGGVNTQTSNV